MGKYKLVKVMAEDVEEITLQELLTDRKYRKMNLKELAFIINTNLLYIDYKQLDGEMSIDKAKNLIDLWNTKK